MEADKPKMSGWVIANIVIPCLSLIFSPFILIWSLSVLGLFPYFFIVLLILFILIPVFYRIYRKSDKCRIALWAARISFVLIAAIYAALPYIGTHFEYDKNFYVPKKLIYTYGVYSPPYTIVEMLPQHLPDDCREYKFITQLGSIAQDAHPSVYLMFYTDSDTIREYEEFFGELPNCVRSDEIGEHDYGKYTGKYVYPKDFPVHALSWLDDTYEEEFRDMRNAAVYRKTDYGIGCLIDYDSGLVVYWT
ncbi:MAG: hypothetical protein IJ071_07390 [Ruminococcus sp.]|nr:hypothetical protein [Ruminococcus sp.]